MIFAHGPPPQPDDDGISIVTSVLRGVSKRHGRIGVTLGHESHLRMPVGDYQKLIDGLAGKEIVDITMMLRNQRFVKSNAEIEKIEYACQLTSDAFIELPNKLSIGMTEVEACRKLKIDLLQRGLDSSPYLISGSGQGSYSSIIMGPTDKVIDAGDVLIIDTGSTYDGYHCDFDRNWAFGSVDDDAKKAHEVVWNATEAGFNAAKPNATMADIFHAMWDVLEAGGALGNDVGRMGHGLGIQLTEGPSVTSFDKTVLTEGAVVTLEPGMTYKSNLQMVHEENIVITADGARWLTKRAPKNMPEIL